MVGFHIYLLHDTLKRKHVTSTNKLALIFCAEAIALEALVNLTFLAAFGGFIYYYLPSDLWHITSLQTLPFYLAAGYIAVTMLVKFKHDKTLFTVMDASLVTVLVFLS